jgi:hypothetical protein
MEFTMSCSKPRKQVVRSANGRFTGEGLRPFTGQTPQTCTLLPLNEARMKVAQDIQGALDTVAGWIEGKVQAQHMRWHHLPIPDVSTPSADFERQWDLVGEGLRAQLRALARSRRLRNWPM